MGDQLNRKAETGSFLHNRGAVGDDEGCQSDGRKSAKSVLDWLSVDSRG
jgi:hypothetical protein